MKTVLKLLTSVFVGVCIATVLAQMIVLGVVWLKGGLTEDKRLRILAVLHDVDMAEMRRQGQPPRRQADGTLSVQSRIQTSDLAIRDTSFRKSLGSLITVESDVKEEKERNELRRKDFENLLARLEEEVIKSSLQDVRRTLEVMKTKQAKAHILRMLDDDAMDHVVALVQAMPSDKRKKILAEFKSREDAQRLHDVLGELRKVGQSDTDATE